MQQLQHDQEKLKKNRNDESDEKESITFVAFMNADNSDIQGNNQRTIVLVVVSLSTSQQPIRLTWNGMQSDQILLDPESVSTFRWAY
jgi:hypothetical protein